MDRIFRLIVGGMVLAGMLAVPSSPGWSADSWKQAFDRLCGVTDHATTFSDAELKALIEDCDTLLQELKSLDVPKKKLYIFRIKKCRNLFQFVLSSRQSSSRDVGTRVMAGR